MAKKIILSQKQLDEICGGDSSYLDGLSSTPDRGNVFATEVSPDGGVERGYAEPTTTDDFAKMQTNNWRGNTKMRGMGPITVREMTKRDWEKEYLEEAREHGNERLKNLNFGAKDGEEGKSYGATKTALCRKRAAEKTAQTGATPEIKQKAVNTLNKMHNNWSGLDNAETQYNAAKANDKNIVNNKPIGQKRKRNNTNPFPKSNGVFLN